jgi:PAS domain-containing protein
LRRTEKELRDLVENMPAMAGVLLPDGSHTYLTNQWREYSGLSVAETDSGGWRRAVHPEDIDAHVEKFRAAAAARGICGHPVGSVFRSLFLRDCGAKKTRVCVNPDCPAPYFLQTRKGQKFCTHRCAVLVNVRRFRAGLAAGRVKRKSRRTKSTGR